MSHRPLARPRYRVAALLGLIGLALGGLAVASPAGAAPAPPTARYIVQLTDLPAAGYPGGIAGYPATKPAVGEKLDKNSAAVTSYRSYLRSTHDAVLSRATSARKLYDYSVAFNGFAAELTAADAATLARTPGVLAVVKDELRRLDTTSTPAFLGLTQPGGLWDQLGGPGSRGAGEGIVVGVVDTGIWPESASFAPLSQPRSLNKWQGTCQTGEAWTVANCSNKIVGARYYTAGQGGPDQVKAQFPYEYLSARDAEGHGSHTSSTAAGDYGVHVVIDGADLGSASGMAPNARVAMYKVCWGRGGEGGCATSDSVQAIDDATADGVDVINFSISGSQTSVVDPVEVAFLFAADAGVFVSASAGNNGPSTSTVAHNDPWVTTVAASTHDRVYTASVRLGNGSTYTGAGLGAAVASSPLLLSTSAGLSDADPTEVRLCYPGTLDPAKVTGAIVVCDRGVNARTDKSLAVKQAGGVGMVLANVAPSSLNADLHFVPTVHVNETDGAAIKAYAATAGATASLTQGQLNQGAQAPLMASFSSRGPALAGGGDLLKPDITAPGVDVLAAVAPPGHNNRSFDFLSGTSMSSPHVAGLAALLRQQHPSWSPMAMKSALLTTASVLDNKGQPIRTDTGGAAGPFHYGSGHVTVNAAADPGLVYESGYADWVRYICGIGQLSATGSTCTKYGRIDPSDLNTPNLAIGSLAGSQTITRTVRNVAKTSGDYTVSVQAPAGVQVSVSPTRLKVAVDGKATYQVTLTRTGAQFDQYVTGSLTWSDGTHRVRSQLVVRPVAVAAPAEVSGSGTAGSILVPLTSGYTGTLTTSVQGLVPASTNTATLHNPTGSSFNTANPQPSDHTAKFTVSVPVGTSLGRFATFDRDAPAGTDLDVFVFKAGTAQLVGQSAGGTAEEQVDLPNAAAGDYDVYVDLYGLAAGQSSLDATLFSWTLGTAAAGNLTATPESQGVTTGAAASVTAAWSGLTAGQRYLGRLFYGDGTTARAATVLRVDG